MKAHNYHIQVKWTGNEGNGTMTYNSYTRNHRISSEEKYGGIDGSSDPSFMGDHTKYNPEELFISAIAACHMLWYLHLCSINNIIVTEYIDHATGIMKETKTGNGKFTEVTLNPNVKITDAELIEKAKQLHTEANQMCFIANSCNFKIRHKARITSATC